MDLLLSSKSKYNATSLSIVKLCSKSSITKADFALIWKQATDQSATKEVVRSFFARCGIWSFDPTAVLNVKFNLFIFIYTYIPFCFDVQVHANKIYSETAHFFIKGNYIEL